MAEAETQALAELAGEAGYKSDALDELLEDSLFKKKKAALRRVSEFQRQ